MVAGVQRIFSLEVGRANGLHTVQTVAGIIRISVLGGGTSSASNTGNASTVVSGINFPASGRTVGSRASNTRTVAVKSRFVSLGVFGTGHFNALAVSCITRLTTTSRLGGIVILTSRT